jgi:eukaryotic-like serine/threonine-protein kinase
LSLTTGTRLGPYEILAPIGAGGMGEVYKARDTRLDRIVAIKVSKDQFSERFQREARAIASLNHPHICQLYDVGPNFLVMEFVEGAPIHHEDSPPKLLDLALQIAAGLVAAHAAGIVHRDLKPGNILVNRSVQVKILDIGLSIIGPVSMEATDARLTAGVTGSGTTVGTVAYMSPEQARGETVDARSDLWSLGVVLYEMATRARPFEGPTSAVVFEALLNKAPVPVRDRNPKIPAELERIIGRLLDKDRETRYQSAADVRADLKRVERNSSSGKTAAVTSQPKPRRSTYLVAVAIGSALLLAAGVAGLFYATRPAVPVTSPSEYVQLTDFTDSAVAPSLSPDGRMLTFIRGGEFFYSDGQIYVKLLPNGEPVRLTSDARKKFGPVFTPDGSRIAYTDAQEDSWDTWTVPVLGGQPTRLLPNASGLTWIADQRVLFSEFMTIGALHMGIVTATEGRANSRKIYFPQHESGMAHYSYASPDLKSILVVEMNQSHWFNIPCRLLPFDGSSAGRQVGPRGTCTSAAWSPDGKWMYFGARVGGRAHLWRQKFPDGAPEQITFGPLEEEGIAVAPDGKSLVTSVGNRRSSVWIHDAAGERVISSEGYSADPRLSRDGKHAFYLFARDLVADPANWVPSSAELRSVDLGSGKTETLLPGVAVTDYDISRDEKEAAFTVTENGESKIWLAALDRSSPAREITTGDQVSFGAEGELIFRSLEGETNLLVRIKKDGSGRTPLTTIPISIKYDVSPDAGWVTALAPDGVLLVPLQGGATRKICTFCRTVWSSDGRFFYVETSISSTASTGQTIAIPVPAGKSVPDLPASGIDLTAGSTLPGVQVIMHSTISPGLNPSTYVFVKKDVQRNLFRIPLH